METEIITLIDEAIELEMNIGRLYSLFGRKCPEDRSFWVQLEVEEYNHAALLRAAKKFLAYSKFPRELVPEKTDQIKQSIRLIDENHKLFESAPDRFNAFSIAYELENSAGELHYQQFMEKEESDEITEIFKKLNRADTDHAKRILNYWTQATLEINSR